MTIFEIEIVEVADRGSVIAQPTVLDQIGDGFALSSCRIRMKYHSYAHFLCTQAPIGIQVIT